MLAVNDNDVGLRLQTVMVLRLIDDLMGLPPLDWETRLATQIFKWEPHLGPTMLNRREPPDDVSIVGEYFDPGYGTLDLRQIPQIGVQHLPAGSDRYISVEQAKLIRTAIETSRIEQLDTSRPMYYAPLPRLWSQGLVFTHFDGPIFNVSIIQIREKTDGTPISRTWGKGSAMFVPEQGVGMFEMFWRGTEGRALVEEDVEENAEVWFAKLP